MTRPSPSHRSHVSFRGLGEPFGFISIHPATTPSPPHCGHFRGMMLGAIFECVELRIPILRPELAQGTRVFSHFSGLTTTVVLARLSHDVSTREGRTPRRAPSHHSRYTGASSHRAAPTQTRLGDSYFVHLTTVRTRPLRPSTGR